MYTPDNIPYISVRELIRDMAMRSATIQFIDFPSIMSPNPAFSYFEVMSSLLRVAVEEFEGRYPLLKRSRVHINGDPYMFIDNFDAFLDGKVIEEYTTLIPKASPYAVDTSILFGGRRWRYERPYLRELWHKGTLTLDYQASYPVRLYKMPDVDDFTDDSRIYYMEMHSSSTKDRMFKLQFLVIVLNHLKSIKNNMRYPDMPMELLQDVEMELSMKQQELTELYRKNPSYAGLSR